MGYPIQILREIGIKEQLVYNIHYNLVYNPLTYICPSSFLIYIIIILIILNPFIFYVKRKKIYNVPQLLVVFPPG